MFTTYKPMGEGGGISTSLLNNACTPLSTYTMMMKILVLKHTGPCRMI